ncbi:MAG: hypothetical protein LIO71_01305 [Ruminococcus sp.]|nr:hypothetical protein [Ruminococcus sp.]MCC8119264.1 hypothetical protein [Bacteroidales bacterium]
MNADEFLQEREGTQKVVERIFGLRKKFVILGLTGRTGSGCTTVANILTRTIDSLKSEHIEFGNQPITNDIRKDRIIDHFIRKNWKPFTIFKASDFIFYYAMQQDFDSFIDMLSRDNRTLSVIQQPKGTNMPLSIVDQALKDMLKTLKQSYLKIQDEILRCEKYISRPTFTKSQERNAAYLDLILKEIPEFRKALNEILLRSQKKVISCELQIWGNEIRLYNRVINNSQQKPKQDLSSPSCLAKKINQFIKMLRANNEKRDMPTLVVIDALRNPYEILYFRERYAAYYTLSVNTDRKVRHDNLYKLAYRKDEIEALDKEEAGKKDIQESYERIDIDKCIEISDIYLTHDGTDEKFNRKLINQIFKYLTLIFHPGLVPPSPMERLMQIAYTAKLNSGCLSRQVGAVVTNEFNSVKAVGWNTVAEGQTPCSLRSLYDLYEQEDENAYSTYEKKNEKFSSYISNLKLAYDEKHAVESLAGVNLSYCFKDIHTTIEEKQRGNQVHTRSLHAEENAFLQLAKYGTTGIKGGKLFTTASCCELCAKKAYQLGIKEIIYIDTYPGITSDHILDCGDNRPQLVLFNGAVGRAYVELYQQLMPLKDEVENVTLVNVKKVSIEKNNSKHP